jgi:hypothetical protein
MWEKDRMTLRRVFRSIIALTVAAGLLSAPFAAPAMAKSHHAAVAVEAMADDMTAAADGMPCCPDEGQPTGCDSCPLLALCSLTLSVPVPSEAVALTPDKTATSAFALPDDLMIAGLGARPPDHPPRTNV